MRKIVLFLSVWVLWVLSVFTYAENAVTTATPVVPAVQLKPMAIQLPKPQFIGTPRNILRNPHFDSSFSRQVLLAPEGCYNLALNRDVTTGCSAPPIIGNLNQITDGRKEGKEECLVELVGTGPQWIQIDLGQVAEVYGVVVWRHYWLPVCCDMVLKTADDKDFTTNVQTHFNNDYDNSSGLGIGNDKEYYETNSGRIISIKGVKTRYVRLYSRGNVHPSGSMRNTRSDVNRYAEVEVWGRPAKDAQPSGSAAPESLKPQPIVVPRPMFI